MNEIKPHKHAIIGIKKLSSADLGLSKSSHQTHIGLFEQTFISLDDIKLIDLCYLITEQETIKLLCLLDYIENPDGTFRSPKIRKGAKEELFFEGQQLNSVVREIRKIVKDAKEEKSWYLLWFVTDNQHLAFALIEFGSELFDLLSAKIDGVKQRQQFDSDSEAFFVIMEVLEPYLKSLL